MPMPLQATSTDAQSFTQSTSRADRPQPYDSSLRSASGWSDRPSAAGPGCSGTTLGLLGGLSLGTALMYWLDPRMGRRRRALTRDWLMRTARQTADAWDTTWHDLSNRSYGLLAELSQQPEDFSDETLVQRIRAVLGRVVRHASAIEVAADRGRVTLRGPILADDVERVFRRVSRIPGVRTIDNQLEAHEHPDDVPGLQGGQRPPAEAVPWSQEHWSPTARLLSGLAGAWLMAYPRRGVDVSCLLRASGGLALLARAVTNQPLRRLTGVGAGHRAVDIQKTIHLRAPVDHVFALWTDYAHFPQFMSHVREVRRLDERRSRWSLQGPAGTTLEWDAEITRLEPGRRIAWKTIGDSPVQHAGIVLFEPDDEGGTRVTVRMSYNPPGGHVGHLLAHLLGEDPKRQMDDDLVRMKTFVEEGKTPADAAMRATRGSDGT